MLTSTVVSAPAAQTPGFTFPGLFRSKAHGSIWLARSPGEALRLSVGGNPSRNPWNLVGDAISETTAFRIYEEAYEQLRGPVTITFNP